MRAEAGLGAWVRTRVREHQEKAGGKMNHCELPLGAVRVLPEGKKRKIILALSSKGFSLWLASSHSWAYDKEDIAYRVCGRAKLLALRGPESGRMHGAEYRISLLGHVPVTGF